MRLTTKGRFAVTAMVDLAKHQDKGPVALATIAERQDISLSYLEQLFSRLRREGLRTREVSSADEGHAARARRQRRFEVFAHGARVAQIALEPFEVADEGGEQVVEVVREPPRELSASPPIFCA